MSVYGLSELETLCAALLALGTDKTAADMARMMDSVSDDRIELMMRTLEENGQFRTASDRVATAMLANPIARLWGLWRCGFYRHNEHGCHAPSLACPD